MLNRVRDLLVDGVLLALPVGLAAFLVKKVVGTLTGVMAPVAHLLPQGRWFGIAALELTAVALVLVPRERVQLLSVPSSAVRHAMKKRGLGLQELTRTDQTVPDRRA